MGTKNLTLDQKVDLLLSQFSLFGKKQNQFDTKLTQFGVKQTKMQKDITDLIEITSSAMTLAAVTSDRVDKLENKKSFTDFTKGTFVA